MTPTGLGDWQRTTYCGDLRAADAGREVTVMGWVHGRRDHGGLIFVDLRDRTGVLQLVFDPARSAGTFAIAEHLRGEFVVAVRGRVEPRTPETINPNLATGEVEVVVADARLLSQARSVPFPIDGTAPITESTRLKYRYLDLRRPEMQQRLLLRHRLSKADARLPGRATASSRSKRRSSPAARPKGPATIWCRAASTRATSTRCRSRRSSSSRLLMVAGFDRYFQIVRCFRDEDLRADRQPEFTQIDVEMSFVRPDDVMAITEGMLRAHVQPRRHRPSHSPSRASPTTRRCGASASTGRTCASGSN